MTAPTIGAETGPAPAVSPAPAARLQPTGSMAASAGVSEPAAPGSPGIAEAIRAVRMATAGPATPVSSGVAGPPQTRAVPASGARKGVASGGLRGEAQPPLVAPPPHGHWKRYNDGPNEENQPGRGCRCTLCRAANTERAREYRQRKARERWGVEPPRLVDAEPARQHVRYLQARDLAMEQIAELSSVPLRTISNLLYGNGGLPPAKRIRTATAEALLAVQPTDLPSDGWVSPVGTQRRLRALAALGWPTGQIATHMGMHPLHIGRLLCKSVCYVTPDTARAARAVYDELWDQAPPAVTRGERTSAGKAKAFALRRGWPPPQAWDDDTIDDPEAQPDLGDETTRAQAVAENYEELSQQGYSAELIAERLGMSTKSLHAYRARARRMEAS